MARGYELETEVTVAFRDYLVEGAIEDYVAGVDSEGEPIYAANVGAQDWLRLSPYDRATMLLVHGHILEDALLDQAQSDFEAYMESRGY